MRSLLLSLLIASASAFSSSPTFGTMTESRSALQAVTSRKDFLFGAASIAASSFLLPTAAFAEETLPNGVVYKVTRKGDGPQPDLGELVAIRFKATAGENVIDDIFETPEPYYTRIGSGGMLKGVEEALPYMRVGDRWTLTIPGNLAFGSKGRPSSAGKPRIPPDATIIFEVEMVGLPGKEPELIELIGDV